MIQWQIYEADLNNVTWPMPAPLREDYDPLGEKN